MKKFILAVCLVLSFSILVGCKKQATTPTDDAADTTVNGEAGDTANTADGDDAAAEGTADAAMVELAQCLKENKVTMYGTERCGHCKNQKEMFGTAFTYVTYVDCDAERQTCLDAGVRGFPTWADAEGNLFPGTQTAERLAEIGKCGGAAAIEAPVPGTPTEDAGEDTAAADEMNDEEAAAEAEETAPTDAGTQPVEPTAAEDTAPTAE